MNLSLLVVKEKRRGRRSRLHFLHSQQPVLTRQSHPESPRGSDYKRTFSDTVHRSYHSPCLLLIRTKPLDVFFFFFNQFLPHHWWGKPKKKKKKKKEKKRKRKPAPVWYPCHFHVTILNVSACRKALWLAHRERKKNDPVITCNLFFSVFLFWSCSS